MPCDLSMKTNLCNHHPGATNVAAEPGQFSKPDTLLYLAPPAVVSMHTDILILMLLK